MDIDKLKQLIDEFQAKLNGIEEEISDIQEDIIKLRKVKDRKLQRFLDLQTDLDKIANVTKMYVTEIESKMEEKNELNSELLGKLLLLIK